MLEVDRGRFLTAADNEKYQNYAVLASTTARTLFPYEDPVGQAVKLGSDYYTVVGVTKERQSSAGIGTSMAAQDFNKDVYIPLEGPSKGGPLIAFALGTLPEDDYEHS